MPADVLISNGTSLTAGTVTLTGVTSLNGPKGERKVIDQTALEDTVTFQDTGIISYAGGITINGGCTTATFKVLNDALVGDTTLAIASIKGAKTASGTMKVTMLEKSSQVQDKVSFSCTMTPTGNATQQA